MDDRAFETLNQYLDKVPAVKKPIAFGSDDKGLWWAKFSIDITHKLAWQVVQEIGYVCNYLSISERLPTIFYPVSPPPYLNSGPKDYLAWVIETKDKDFKPDILMQWLEERMPQPVDDITQWIVDENSEETD
jgi:hypothetical protein